MRIRNSQIRIGGWGWMRGILFALLAVVPFGARAEFTGVPAYLSAPMSLYDDGGNLLPDGDYGVTVTLKGSDGGTLFEERHTVSVVNGVTGLTIGAGETLDAAVPSGGLSRDVFLASDEITVEVRVDGLPIVQEAAVFGAQPYAFVSEYALGLAPDAVTGVSILDGSITENDLEPSFLAALSPFLHSSDEEGVVDPVLTAEVIAVDDSATFDNSSAATVEGVLRDLDASLTSLRSVELPLVREESAAALEEHVEGFSGVHGVIGNVVGTEDAQILTNKTMDATNAISGTAIKVGVIEEEFIADDITRDTELSYENLSGMISDNQIPAELARDTELAFENLSGTVSDDQIPSEITRDSELSFANLSGSVSDEQIPSAFARDSELSFSNLSGSISDGQIPSTMTRDSELSFSNLSGAASDVQIPSTITRDSELDFSNLSGSISDGQIPSSIVRDSELSFSNLSGSATDSQVPSSIARDSELSFSNLSGTVSSAQIPSSLRPFAYGTFSRPSGGTCSGYNVDSDCTFTSNASSSTYYVAITPLGSLSCGSYAGACYVSSKSSSSFAITCQCPGGGTINPQLDFVVFQQ